MHHQLRRLLRAARMLAVPRMRAGHDRGNPALRMAKGIPAINRVKMPGNGTIATPGKADADPPAPELDVFAHAASLSRRPAAVNSGKTKERKRYFFEPFRAARFR
jgi:hypothetical protein